MPDMSKVEYSVDRDEMVDVDEEVLTAIDEGRRAADEGPMIGADEVRALLGEWRTRFSTRPRP